MCTKMSYKTKKQNRQIVFVELHTKKVHAKFKVPSMYGNRMNVSLQYFEKSRLEVCSPIVGVTLSFLSLP